MFPACLLFLLDFSKITARGLVTSPANSSQDIGRYLSDLGVLDSFRVSSIFSYFQEDHFYERMGTKINKEKI